MIALQYGIRGKLNGKKVAYLKTAHVKIEEGKRALLICPSQGEKDADAELCAMREAAENLFYRFSTGDLCKIGGKKLPPKYDSYVRVIGANLAHT